MEKVGLGKFSGLCLLDRLTFETQENLHSKELLNTQKHIVEKISEDIVVGVRHVVAKDPRPPPVHLKNHSSCFGF